jgi:hypothetical protein
VVAELDTRHATGWRGSVFVVDDKFIGNRREVAKLLPHLSVGIGVPILGDRRRRGKLSRRAADLSSL